MPVGSGKRICHLFNRLSRQGVGADVSVGSCLCDRTRSLSRVGSTEPKQQERVLDELVDVNSERSVA